MIALRIGLLLALSLTIGHAADAPIPCNDGKGECVKLHLCQDGTINTDGSNLIDIRFNDEDPCEHYLLKCCEIGDLGEEIVEPPNSEIISVPLPSDENQHKGDGHTGGNVGQEEKKEPEGNNGHGGNDGGNKGSGGEQGNYYGGHQSGAGGGSSNTYSSSSSSTNENSANNCKLVCQSDHQNSANGDVKGTGNVSGNTISNVGGTSSSGGLVTEGQHAGSVHNVGQVGASNTAGGMYSGSKNEVQGSQGGTTSTASGKSTASQNVGQGGDTGTGSTGGTGFASGSGSQAQGGALNSASGGSTESHHTGQTGGSGSTSGSHFGNSNELQSANQLQGSQGGSTSTTGGKSSSSQNVGQGGGTNTGSTGGSGTHEQGGAFNIESGGSTESHHAGQVGGSGSTSGTHFGNSNQLQGSQGGTSSTSGGKSTASQIVGQASGTGTGSIGSTGFVSGSGFQEQEGAFNSTSGGSTGSHHTGQISGSGSTSATNFGDGNELHSANQGSHGATTNNAGGKSTGSYNSGETGSNDTGSVGGSSFVSGSASQGKQDAYTSATGEFTGSQHSSQTGGFGSTDTFGSLTNSVGGGQSEVGVGTTENNYSGQQSGTHSSSTGSMGSSQKYTSDFKGSGTQSVVQGTGPSTGYSESSGTVAQGTQIVIKDQVKQQHTVTQETHTSENSHYQSQTSGSQHSGFYNQHSNQYDKYTDRGVKGENIRENVQGTTVGPMVNVENVGCGVRNADGVGFRITGNSDGESEYGEFPWMVAILKEEKALEQVINVYQCGGSLIHPAVVLTAAHCVQNKQPQDLKIRLGEWDTQTTNEIHDHQDRNVVEIVYHEKFYKGGLFNDIALLFLDKPAEVIETVNTVCLPPQDFNFDLKRCFASGWGKDVFGKEGKYQVILKKIELPVMPFDTCQKAMRTTRLGARFVLNKSFMCAGGEKGKDTCKGDGGSPLVCPIPGSPNRYYQAGIVAWGIGCGENGIPGIYANVAGFRKWIDDHLTQRSITHDYYIYV